MGKNKAHLQLEGNTSVLPRRHYAVAETGISVKIVQISSQNGSISLHVLTHLAVVHAQMTDNLWVVALRVGDHADEKRSAMNSLFMRELYRRLARLSLRFFANSSSFEAARSNGARLPAEEAPCESSSAEDCEDLTIRKESSNLSFRR